MNEPWQLGMEHETMCQVWSSSNKTLFEIKTMLGAENRPHDLAERIVACVNACHGIPAFNGTITMISDMKAAILSGDMDMLLHVGARLREIYRERSS